MYLLLERREKPLNPQKQFIDSNFDYLKSDDFDKLADTNKEWAIYYALVNSKNYKNLKPALQTYVKNIMDINDSIDFNHYLSYLENIKYPITNDVTELIYEIFRRGQFDIDSFNDSSMYQNEHDNNDIMNKLKSIIYFIDPRNRRLWKVPSTVIDRFRESNGWKSWEEIERELDVIQNKADIKSQKGTRKPVSNKGGDVLKREMKKQKLPYTLENIRQYISSYLPKTNLGTIEKEILYDDTYLDEIDKLLSKEYKSSLGRKPIELVINTLLKFLQQESNKGLESRK